MCERIRRGIIVAALLAGVGSSAAAAPSRTSIEILGGGGFRDAAGGRDTADGVMFTASVTHEGRWARGDARAFLDVAGGRFVDVRGARVPAERRVFAQCYPRLSLSRLTGKKWALGPLADVHAAAGAETVSDARFVHLVGASVDLVVPPQAAWTVTLYSRREGTARAWQWSSFWGASLGGGLWFEGQAHHWGKRVVAEPRLVFRRGGWGAGIEYGVFVDGARSSLAPQLLVSRNW